MGYRPAVRSRLGRRSPRLMVGVLVVISLGVLAGLASFPPDPDLVPIPNGTDSLIAAGSAIEEPWPNQGRLDQADPVELRAFVERNRGPLERVRVGLGQDGRFVFEDSYAGLSSSLDALNRIYQIMSLLAAEHHASAAEGRIDLAWRSDIDALRIGQACTQGGMLVHAEVGWAKQRIILARLRSLHDRLTSADCRAIIGVLANLDARRVTPEALVARWERWFAGSWGVPFRMLFFLNGMQAAERAKQQARGRAAADKAGRTFRFLMVQLAVRSYFRDRAKLPRSLDDLVPAYLGRVPIDPTTGNTIDYPRTPEGDLADDLGRVGGAEEAGPPKPDQPPPSPPAATRSSNAATSPSQV